MACGLRCVLGMRPWAEHHREGVVCLEGKARVEYADPNEFFSRTFMTDGLTDLLKQTVPPTIVLGCAVVSRLCPGRPVPMPQRDAAGWFLLHRVAPGRPLVRS